jgi:trimeric autotransporter adhesin
VVLLALNLPAIAQTYCGGVRGSITDPGGASVAGASITLTDESTHQTRNTTSDSAGTYAFSALKPSIYGLQVTAGGFGPAGCATSSWKHRIF